METLTNLIESSPTLRAELIKAIVGNSFADQVIKEASKKDNKIDAIKYVQNICLENPEEFKKAFPDVKVYSDYRASLVWSKNLVESRCGFSLLSSNPL